MAPAKKQAKKQVKPAAKKPAASAKKAAPAKQATAAKAAAAKRPASDMIAKPAVRPAARPHAGLGRGLDSLIVPATRVAPVAPAAAGTTAAAGNGISGATATTATKQPAPGVKQAEAAVATTQAAAPAESGKNVLQVKVSDIERCPWQPRENFNDEQLAELSDSIRVHGVIQPLVCRRAPDGTCQLIAGERRLRAAIIAGLEKVPVVMVDADDRDAAEMTVIENIQRADLNVIEEAEGYRTLSERFGLTQQEVSERVGKARASIANSLRLLDLPDEVKQMLGDGRLSPGHGKVLLGLDGENEQIILARRSVEEGLTVRTLEKLLEKRRAVPNPNPVRAATPDIPESHRKDLEDRLHGHFGAKVTLVPGVTFANGKRSHGRITIDFSDNDELSRLLDVFGVAVE